MVNFMDNDQVTFALDNRPNADPSFSKKNPKIKREIRIGGGKLEDGNKQQRVFGNDSSSKLASASAEGSDPNYNPYTSYKKDSFQEEQMKQINDKNMEYNASTFITPNLDPMKRLSDPMSSPFNFYQSNGRMRPFSNFSLGPFTNEEALSSMLKSYSQFGFPLSSNGQFLNKPPPNGEIDEKIFDTAKVLNYLGQSGTVPLNRQNMFNFQPNDFQKLASTETLRQSNTRNESEYPPNYAEDPHDEIPSSYKGDPRFETTAQVGNHSNRRVNYEGYFGNFEEDYSGERQKKLKHN